MSDGRDKERAETAAVEDGGGEERNHKEKHGSSLSKSE